MDDLFVLYITFFKNVLGPDFILMAYNVRTDRAHLVREFLKMWEKLFDGLASQISWPNRYRACLGCFGKKLEYGFRFPETSQGLKIALKNE